MNKNVGLTDKYIRLIIGAILIISGILLLGSNATLGITLIVLSIIPIGTALLNTCLIYSIFGINTCKAKTT